MTKSKQQKEAEAAAKEARRYAKLEKTNLVRNRHGTKRKRMGGPRMRKGTGT